MKKLATLLFLTAFCLWAADFWTAKPYTDWNEKDIQKMLNDSPWAHKLTVETGGGMPGGGAGGRGGDAGGIGEPGGAERPGIAETAGTAGSRGDAGGGGGGKGGRGASGPQGGTDGPPPVATTSLTIVWQSALPVKQALLKAKYGSEVKTSADAKKILEREEQFYILAVRGLPSMLARGGADLKKIMMEQSSLNVKGKEPVRPADVQVSVAPQGIEAFFLFPRTAPFTVDDKEVEFASKVVRMNIKYKFHLKDMVFSNKLEM